MTNGLKYLTSLHIVDTIVTKWSTCWIFIVAGAVQFQRLPERRLLLLCRRCRRCRRRCRGCWSFVKFNDTASIQQTFSFSPRVSDEIVSPYLHYGGTSERSTRRYQRKSSFCFINDNGPVISVFLPLFIRLRLWFWFRFGDEIFRSL